MGWRQRAVCAGATAVMVGALSAGCSGGGDDSRNGACDTTSVAKKVLPSVVTITATNGSIRSTGSGEVIRNDGYIMTNNHVVSPAASGGTIDVLFSDGSTASASITGRDPPTD